MIGYELDDEVIARGDSAVVVVVRPGLVAVAAEAEPAVPEAGNTGTGGNVDNCNRGIAGGWNDFKVCAACDGKG